MAIVVRFSAESGDWETHWWRHPPLVFEVYKFFSETCTKYDTEVVVSIPRAAHVAAMEQDMTPYEQQRLENIRRNEAEMVRLM